MNLDQNRDLLKYRDYNCRKKNNKLKSQMKP